MIRSALFFPFSSKSNDFTLTQMCRINLAWRVDKILGLAGKQGDTKIPVNTLEGKYLYIEMNQKYRS